MKKKLFAMVCAVTLVLGMGITASAESATAGKVVSQANNSGQVLTYAAVEEFATTTTVTTSVEGTKIEAVSAETAVAVIAKANEVVGANTFIASIIDLQVPEGTGAATFTLHCPNVWKGQKVTILHQLKDGSFESIAPSSVENNAVTFTLTSYSPVAIVIDAAAPRTAGASDMTVVVVAVMGIAGMLFFGRKARA